MSCLRLSGLRNSHLKTALFAPLEVGFPLRVVIPTTDSFAGIAGGAGSSQRPDGPLAGSSRPPAGIPSPRFRMRAY
uniref:Uncharacterized protein n=1 Tax=Mycena chlorophos TaxID=658473 RepID=A0ABQ0LL78_MYCCL|nr:predicted protein [Mycena chlorophos]